MLPRTFWYMPLLLVAGAVAGEEVPAGDTNAQADTKTSETAASGEDAKGGEVKAATGAKTLSGMSILGNQEAPKSLVIVPWKSSELGDTLGLSKILDDSRRPVDKEVFMRELSYYEIRSQ